MKNYLQTNKELWNAKTRVHKDSAFYDLEGFRETKNSLNSIELEALLPVQGKSLLHLQCHFGMDSLSWANLGAEVTGIDLSDASIKLARQLSEELEIDARFVETDLYSLPEKLDGQFDLVFTSYGTIVWLPDLDEWAAVIDTFTRPGGTFYMAEFHPYIYTFDFDTLEVSYPYFNNQDGFTEENEGTYAEPDAPIKTKEHFWCHSLDEVISALLRRGYQLLEFKEFDYSPYNCFPNMKERAPGEYVFGDFGVRIPHVFSLKVKKVKR